MIDALRTYEAGLRTGRARLVTTDGQVRSWAIPAWTGALDAGDEMLIDGCLGATLDVGCGPGRLTEALQSRGVPALGVDISELAVEMTRQRGAAALRRDVFAPLPGTGRWQHLLLADGNIGIGGHPGRLLRRCTELLAPGGSVLLDLEAPGAGLLVELVRIQAGTAVSEPFRWCWLGVDALLPVAAGAGLIVHDIWAVGERWQARLLRPR